MKHLKRLSMMLLLASISGAVTGQPIVVTNLNDSGPGSLREAVASASGGDTITFAPSVTGTINLTSGRIIIDSAVALIGPGPSILTISGGDSVELLESNSDLFVSGLKLRRSVGTGITSYEGLVVYDCVIEDNASNGILAFGNTCLQNCAIVDNVSSDDGGGLESFDTTVIQNCLFDNNSAADDGGGLITFELTYMTNCIVLNNSSGDDGGGMMSFEYLIIDRTLFEGNVAGGSGGGIMCFDTISVTNSTFSGNTAYTGGGLYDFATTFMAYTTITNNTATDYGGGLVFNDNSDTLRMINTLIAGNTADSSRDVANWGTHFISWGTNLIGVMDVHGFTPHGSDIVGTVSSPVNPMLGSLSANGGPTKTHALLAGSPAIDAATDTLVPATDQRSFHREAGLSTDIGAFEYNSTDAGPQPGDGSCTTEVPTGVRPNMEIPQASLRVYPVPAGDWIVVQVNLENRPMEIELLRIDGMVVHTRTNQATSSGLVVIDVSDLPPGTYLVRCTSDRTVAVGRFMKQ